MIRLNIMGFKGGSGKSTIAYYLALYLSDHYNVALVDKTYSGTISKIFNINNDIFSFLKGKNQPFYMIKGNLRVINMSFPIDHSIENINFDSFKYLYSKVFENTDITIVDTSSLPHDFVTELELKAFMESFRNFTLNSILVLSNDELPLKKYLNYTALLNELAKHYAEDILGFVLPKDTEFIRIWAIVINKVLKDQETKISALLGNDEILIKPARFIIPFYPSLIRRHFKDVNPPDEILKLATYINDLIREPKSIL
ncbi:MAG: hypothetical protein QXS44_04750, partial [Saccharolobus sp.]